MCYSGAYNSGTPILYSFFFFQAEDGIRDGHVTGVQTCALPIFRISVGPQEGLDRVLDVTSAFLAEHPDLPQIGRASCRERVEISGGAMIRNKQKMARGNKKISTD